jgi:hypothetical protein
MANRITTTIPANPSDAPNIQSQTQTEFSQNADAFVTYTQNLNASFNSFSSQANALANEVNDKADDAATSEANALESANKAEVFAGLQNFKGDYSAGSYDIGDSVYYQGAYFINGTASNTNNPVSGGWSIIPKADFEPSVKPILDLDFANQEYSEWEAPIGKTNKLLANILDVTRSSKAGYTDPTGMGRTVADNTARLTYDAETGVSEGLLVEESRTNLVKYPNDFNNTAWVKRGGSAIQANAITAPNGTLTADKHYNTDTALNGSYIRQAGVFSSDNTVYCASCYVKRGSQPEADLIMYAKTDASDSARLSFNFDNETFTISNLGQVTDAKGGFQTLPNGWYRLWVSANMLSGVATTGVNYSPSTWGLPDSISSEYGYIWGAQIEQGSFPTSPIPDATIFNSRASTGTYYDSTGTLQTAADDVARYTYNPANLKAEPVLLLEEARTNLVTYSTTLTVDWSGSNATVTPNSGTSPDGTNNALKVTSTSATGVVYSDKSIVSGEPYTLSVYAKKGTSNNARVRFTNMASGAVNCDIDFSAGTPTISLGSITYVGNDWYRVSISDISANTTTRVGLYGDMVGSGHTLFYAPQLEQGSYPTSYIPTTTAQVTRAADLSTGVQATRAADSIVRDLSTLDGWNGREFTWFLDFVMYEDTGVIGGLGDTFNDCFYISQFSLNSRFNGTSGIEIASQLIKNTRYKIIVTHDATQYKYYANGVLIGSTEISSSLKVWRNKLLSAPWENTSSSNNTVCGNVYSHKLLPKALSEAEAIALTS